MKYKTQHFKLVDGDAEIGFWCRPNKKSKYPSQEEFINHVKKHFVNKRELWNMVFGKDFRSRLRHIINDKNEYSLQEIYDEIVQKLSEGIDWSTTLPLYVWHKVYAHNLQNRTEYDEHMNVFIAWHGFCIIVKHDIDAEGYATNDMVVSAYFDASVYHKIHNSMSRDYVLQIAFERMCDKISFRGSKQYVYSTHNTKKTVVESDYIDKYNWDNPIHAREQLSEK